MCAPVGKNIVVEEDVAGKTARKSEWTAVCAVSRASSRLEGSAITHLI